MDLEVPGRGEDLVRGATGGEGPFPGLGDRVCGGTENTHQLCLGKAKLTPESLGLLNGVAMPWTGWDRPHRGGRVGTTDPQLSQSLVLRVVFL